MFSCKTNNSFPIQKPDEEMVFNTLTFFFVDNTVSIVTFLQRKKEQYSDYTTAQILCKEMPWRA